MEFCLSKGCHDQITRNVSECRFANGKSSGDIAGFGCKRNFGYNRTKLDAEIFLNQGTSTTHDSTEFELSVHADGGQGMDKMSMGSTSNALVTDSDQSSWERLSSEFTPEGTDFLVYL